MIEVWKHIPGFGEYYEASSLGRIRSRERMVTKRHKCGRKITQKYKARIIGSKPNAEGYVHAHISVHGRKSNQAVHRLIALAFHGEPLVGQECCHNNGNPSDNRPENLRWDTHLENNRDRKRHGNYANGPDHAASKFPVTLLAQIAAGQMTVQQAAESGVSRTHFYRVRRGEYGIDLLAEATALWRASEALYA